MNQTQCKNYVEKLDILTGKLVKNEAWFKYFTTHFNYIEQRNIILNSIYKEKEKALKQLKEFD